MSIKFKKNETSINLIESIFKNVNPKPFVTISKKLNIDEVTKNIIINKTQFIEEFENIMMRGQDVTERRFSRGNNKMINIRIGGESK